MADRYLIKADTLVDMAAPLRELSGLTDELSPSEMISISNQVNEEVDAQANLIASILETFEQFFT